MKVKFDLKVHEKENLEEVLNELKKLKERTKVDMEVGLILQQSFKTAKEIIRESVQYESSSKS